jgi:hypothetical protein
MGHYSRTLGSTELKELLKLADAAERLLENLGRLPLSSEE